MFPRKSILVLLPFLLFLVGLPCLEPKAVAADQEIFDRAHSIQPPFIDSNMENRYWDFGGATVVNTNKYVRLTPDRQSRKGWLWSKEPLSAENWSVEFDFKVHGAGTSVYGDGFAFWVTSERATQGDVFGNRDMFTGLGVFFDTYPNSRHSYGFPYVSVMIGDGRTRYSNNDDNEVNSLGGCQAYFRGQNWPTRAKVTYLYGTLTVELDVKGKDTLEECVSVSGYQLAGPLYIGFTAATGDVADNHDIMKVTTHTIGSSRSTKPNVVNYANQNKAQQTAKQETQRQPPVKPNRRSTRDSEGSGWGVFTWLFVVILAIAILAAGAFAIAKLTNSSKKRF